MSSGGSVSEEQLQQQQQQQLRSPDQLESTSSTAHQQPPSKPTRRPSSPNAQSVDITVARGAYTAGTVNQHPNPEAAAAEERTSGGGGGGAASTTAMDSTAGGEDQQQRTAGKETIPFRVGVSEDRNKKCRRTMEDAHAFVYDFGGVKGQGYFAVFDGHAGKHAAEWCGANFHKYLLEQLRSGDKSQPVPDLLNQTFHIVDGELSKLAAAGGTHSGCTAVTAFLRLEDESGAAVELENYKEKQTAAGDHWLGSESYKGGAASTHPAAHIQDEPAHSVTQEQKDIEAEEKKRRFGDGSHREKLKNLFGGGSGSPKSSASSSAAEEPSSNTASGPASTQPAQQQLDRPSAGIDESSMVDMKPGIPKNMAKRTLYTANVGDARAVLSRGGKAVRLTYDHKGSDAQEAKRITDAGGFVMNNRVNGVLAVTRSLGDSSMKEFVVGSPYTTETTLGDDDDFLIIACDGLWDVCEDQDAVDLIRDVKDPQEASRVLLDHALQNFSTDNLSVLVVALRPSHA